MLHQTFSPWKMLAACLLLWIAPTPALASDALIKNEVQVDVTGKDAVDARTRALAQAEIEGLRSMLERFTSPQQAQMLIDSLSPQRISGLARGIEVISERISDRRYRAQLLVAFDGEEISSLISTAMPGGGTVLDAPASTAFLILPVYEEGSRQMLWEADNPWKNIWKTVGLEAASIGIVVPYGDNTDAGIFKPGQAQSASFTSLSNLTNRYGASDVVIAHAQFTATPDMRLTVIRRRVNATSNEAHLLTYRADPEETKDMLLTRAALDIVQGLQQLKTEAAKNLFMGGERNNIMILASISTMASWTQLRSKLTSLPMVEKVDVLAISPKQVDMNVRYRGTAESLESALVAQGLRLHRNLNYWVISRD